jgi:hypothetical protein
VTSLVRHALPIGMALLNVVVYWFSFLVGARLLYWGQTRPLLMCVNFLIVGGLSRFWSERWWSSAVPALLDIPEYGEAIEQAIRGVLEKYALEP